jgi:hypothetical protein
MSHGVVFGLAIAVAFGSGCSPLPGELDPAAVQAIPPGDGLGSALSGSYRIRRVTRSCSGVCGGMSSSGHLVSVCDVGVVETLTVALTQENGRLRAEVNDRPALYQGGVNRDGSYQLGAYATQAATLQITVRTSGVVQPMNLSGVALSHSWGSYAGVGLDCTGELDLSPERE